jgi:F-type H+-transporting ATPase subunit b
MDDRDNSIAKDLKAAKGLGGNTDELNAKADENISNAKTEAANIRQKAVEAEKELSAKKAEAKKSELDSKYAKFAEQLSADKEHLKKSLIADMPLFKKSLQAKFSKL